MARRNCFHAPGQADLVADLALLLVDAELVEDAGNRIAYHLHVIGRVASSGMAGARQASWIAERWKNMLRGVGGVAGSAGLSASESAAFALLPSTRETICDVVSPCAAPSRTWLAKRNCGYFLEKILNPAKSTNKVHRF